MGILNVTPDSFSDGGRFPDPAAAIAAGRGLVADGADLVDVGGESTRPGSRPVPAEVERERVLPVVRALAAEGVVVSIDTTKAEVAAAALEAGAEVVNDVSGLRTPEMRRLCAAHGAGVVVTHMQGDPATMQEAPHYGDVVVEVFDWLRTQAARVEEAGIAPERIALDPGFGFGKTYRQNLLLLAELPRLVAFGYPVLVGTSRKTFLGVALEEAGRPRPPAGRDAATAATLALAVAAGAAVVRVHDAAMATDVVRVADAIVRAPRAR